MDHFDKVNLEVMKIDSLKLLARVFRTLSPRETQFSIINHPIQSKPIWGHSQVALAIGHQILGSCGCFNRHLDGSKSDSVQSGLVSSRNLFNVCPLRALVWLNLINVFSGVNPIWLVLRIVVGRGKNTQTSTI